ncbi:MAG: hypothetical protein ACO1NO_07585 [Burkholderiaceae bacterium]
MLHAGIVKTVSDDSICRRPSEEANIAALEDVPGVYGMDEADGLGLALAEDCATDSAEDAR